MSLHKLGSSPCKKKTVEVDWPRPQARGPFRGRASRCPSLWGDISLHLDYLRVYIYIYIYVYIYILWHPNCARRHPGTVTAVPNYGPHLRVAVQGHCKQVRLHGSRGGVFVGHRRPRDTGGPLLDFGKYQGRSFTSIQMFHTHAPLPRGI